MSSRPADKRRVVTVDLTPTEKVRVAAAAKAAGRSVSRWVADAVREAVRKEKR